jgi:hypothetical protein
MASIAEQLAALRAEIAQEERRLSDLQIQAIDMRVAVAALLAEYEQRIWPWQEELQHVQQQIEDIRGYSDKLDISGLPADYVPVEEQYRRTWRPRAGDKLAGNVDFKPRSAATAGGDEAGLKRLYRKLALQFHPDLAPDEPTRQRWTEFMRKINDAYAARDEAALRGLAEALYNEAPPDPGLTTERGLALLPDEDELSRAKSRLQAVQLAIQSVEGEIFDVEWGWEMKLRREIDAAQKKGRDLLGEIAADLQARLEKARRELAALQGG